MLYFDEHDKLDREAALVADPPPDNFTKSTDKKKPLSRLIADPFGCNSTDRQIHPLIIITVTLEPMMQL